MAKKDDQLLVVFLGGKPDSDDNSGGFAGVFLGLLAIALTMIFFTALLRDAERRQQNYYPQNYFPQSYYPPVQPKSLQPVANSVLLPCSRGV